MRRPCCAGRVTSRHVRILPGRALDPRAPAEGGDVKIAVIYYSATGNLHRMATALGAGAAELGAEVRVRRVRELAPPEAIASNPRWAAHHAAMAGEPEAT